MQVSDDRSQAESVPQSPWYLSLPPCSQQGPMERDDLSPEPVVYSFIYILQIPQVKSPPTKRGKIFSHRPRSPTQTEGLHTMGCSLVPQGHRI